MRRYLVSRHGVALDWVSAQGFVVDEVLSHFDDACLERVQAGDVVMGTLPIQIVAELTLKGVCYYHLLIPLTSELRGRTLTLEELNSLDVQLVAFTAKKIFQVKGALDERVDG